MKKKVRQAAELARRIPAGDSADRDLLEAFRERYDELNSEQRRELFCWLSGELEVSLDELEKPLEDLVEEIARIQMEDDHG